MTAPVSVILIREHAEQLTGSGCCGKLEGDQAAINHLRLFRHARADQEMTGLLHRTIRQFFPPLDGKERVAIITIDPRNQLALVPELLGDVFRYRPGWRNGLSTALQLFSLPAVVINGRVLSRRGQSLDPDAVSHEIARLLESRIPGGQKATSTSA